MVSTSIVFMLQPHNVYFYQIMFYNMFDDKYQKGIIILKRSTRSLLEELNSIALKKDNEALVESRATHVINGAINLLSAIREQYSPDEAYELERRFINSIKSSDPNKFVRGIRKLRDNKETAKNLKLIEGNLKEDD